MQKVGNAAEMAAYAETLSRPGNQLVQIELRVLDLSGNLIKSITPTANSGQVDITTGGDITRSASLTFLDESRSLQFDPDSPSTGAVYFDNMIQVRHKLWVPELGKYLSCSVITGPLTKYDRTADEVSIEIQGKESLAMQSVPTREFKKGANAVSAIRDMLEHAGETQFSMPSSNARLPRTRTVGWASETYPWVVAQSIAASLGLQLYYDGAGVCRLRDQPGQASFTFRTGEGGNITQPVQVSHEKAAIRNRVKVIGSKPTITYTANLEDSHKYSSWTLRRNGKRTYLYEEIQNSNIGAVSGAKVLAERTLNQYRNMEFGSTFSALPAPHLDELDLFRIETDEFVSVERLRQVSIPLTGGEMTVGYNDLVSFPRKAVRKP